jgi:hypothetical protein
MTSIPTFEGLIWALAAFLGIVALSFAPVLWISTSILAPIDKAAKFRKAAVGFSIGDFLCLFLAIQLPLTAVYQFVRESGKEAYWGFTTLTWLVAPFIWFACARALSRAQITNSWHRIGFLGLVMPLVYYGLIPFTVLGIGLFLPFEITFLQLPQMPLTWITLAVLFFLSGRFVKHMLKGIPVGETSASDEAHEREALRTANCESGTGLSLSPAHRAG